MILTRTNTIYSIDSSNYGLRLSGGVLTLNGEINMNVFIYADYEYPIGTACYIYKQGTSCTKSISNIKRSYVENVEKLLEDTLTFLLEEFNMLQL